MFNNCFKFVSAHSEGCRDLKRHASLYDVIIETIENNIIIESRHEKTCFMNIIKQMQISNRANLSVTLYSLSTQGK